MRPWCAVVQFADKRPFLFGTVWLRPAEGEEAAR